MMHYRRQRRIVAGWVWDTRITCVAMTIGGIAEEGSLRMRWMILLAIIGVIGTLVAAAIVAVLRYLYLRGDYPAYAEVYVRMLRQEPHLRHMEDWDATGILASVPMADAEAREMLDEHFQARKPPPEGSPLSRGTYADDLVEWHLVTRLSGSDMLVSVYCPAELWADDEVIWSQCLTPKESAALATLVDAWEPLRPRG